MQPLTLLSLFGIAVALFLGVRLVITPTENRAAASAFAAFLLCGALFMLDDAFYRENWFARWPWFYGVANPFIAAVTPCFYLYTAAATAERFRWRWGMLWHTVPIVLLALLQIPVLFLSVEEKLAWAAHDFDPAARREVLWFGLLLDVYFYAYLGAAWVQLWRARERVAERQEEGRSHPLRGIGIFATALLVAGLVTSVLDYTKWAQTGSLVAVLAAVVALFGLLWSATQPQPFIVGAGRIAAGKRVGATGPAGPGETAGVAAPLPPAVAQPASGSLPETAADGFETAVLVVPAPPATSEEAAAGDAAAGSRGLRPDEAARIAARLRRLFEEQQVFLDAGLSLHGLAEQAKTTRHKLSAVLRQEFGATFYQLVARYRVREAARILRTRAGAARTIADIAFASGFNTLSAFNAAFRAEFGVTPSAFRGAAPDHRAPGDTSAAGR